MKESLASILFAFSFATANAATFTVTNTNDSGPGSLRDAIAQANAAPGADTVIFDSIVTGTILLTTGAIKISDALTIVGPGASVLTIDGNANGRIFNVFLTAPACPAFDTPTDYLVSISGLRLSNGRNTASNAGGAIYSEHSLAFDSVIFDHNVAGQGGGVWLKQQYPGQVLTITNTQFLYNTAKPVIATPGFPHSGGALGIEDKCTSSPVTPSPVTIANGVFRGNRSQPVALNGFGGAIAMFSAYMDVTISDTRIADNHIDVPSPAVTGNLYRGGGLFSSIAISPAVSPSRPKSLTIIRSEISDNSTNAASSGVTQGGAIAFVNAAPKFQTLPLATALNIVNSTISANTDDAFGGGLWAYGNVAVSLYNSTTSNNTAPVTHGGGIFLTTGPTLPGLPGDPTIALPPTLTLVSSIVADNTDDDVASSAIPAFTINATNSLTGTICSTCDISIAGSGNLTGVDPMLAPLDFYGGPTRTQALLPGSPAIGAGSNPVNLATDQRGAGFPRQVNGATDIGAYEFEDTVPPVTVATPSAPPNGAGWNNTNLTVTLSSTDNAGGSGVKQINFATAGAQTGLGVIAGSSASVLISAEGTTTVTYYATDFAGNAESPKTLTLKIDKAPPGIYGMPSAGCTLSPANGQMIQVAGLVAIDAFSGVLPGSFALSAASNEPSDPANPDVVVTRYGPQKIVVQLRAARLVTGTGRTYTLNATATDRAGNTTTASATCVVPLN